MKLYNLSPKICLGFLLYITGTLLVGPEAVSAATINTVATFNGTNGFQPLAGLVEDSQGNFFGTNYSYMGPTNINNGTIFEVSTNTQSVPEPDFVFGCVVTIGGLIVRSMGKGKR